MKRQMPTGTETMPGNTQGKIVEAASGVSFSVVFFDGEKEVNIGNITVFPSTTYKNFQSVLSNKIGISPNQFSIYLCKISNSTLDSGNRMPVTGRVDFSVVMKQKYCYFLVVLRRRKTVRKQRGNKEWLSDEYDLNTEVAATTQPIKKNPSANRILLRRNTSGMENQTLSGYRSPMVEQLEYENWNRNLQIERESYLMNTGLANFYSGWLENEKRDFLLNCIQCWKAKMIGSRDDEFHCCVDDHIIVGFRTAAGPVARPIKRPE